MLAFVHAILAASLTVIRAMNGPDTARSALGRDQHVET